jgi:pseudoazurin
MRIRIFLILLVTFLAAPSSYGAEFTVNAVTTGANGEMMVFSPGYLKVEVGDTVNFIPSDASHNAESFVSPSPETAFVTALGEGTRVTFSQEGVYLYKCTPHFVLGMVGVIQVGKAVNKNEALAVWKPMEPMMSMNQGRMATYLEQID